MEDVMKQVWMIGLVCSMWLAVSHPLPALAMGTRPGSDMEETQIDEHPSPVAIPDISFNDQLGKEYYLSQYRGYVVMLNFWATWCPPCVREMPALDRLQGRYGYKGLAVISVAQDRGTQEKSAQQVVTQFYNQYGVRYLGIYYNQDAASYSNLHIPGLPTTLLIDRHGRERARIRGAIDWESPAFIKKLEDLLNSGE